MTTQCVVQYYYLEREQVPSSRSILLTTTSPPIAGLDQTRMITAKTAACTGLAMSLQSVIEGAKPKKLEIWLKTSYNIIHPRWTAMLSPLRKSVRRKMKTYGRMTNMRKNKKKSTDECYLWLFSLRDILLVCHSTDMKVKGEWIVIDRFITFDQLKPPSLLEYSPSVNLQHEWFPWQKYHRIF